MNAAEIIRIFAFTTILLTPQKHFKKYFTLFLAIQSIFTALELHVIIVVTVKCIFKTFERVNISNILKIIYSILEWSLEKKQQIFKAIYVYLADN